MEISIQKPILLLVEGGHPVTILPGNYTGRREGYSVVFNKRPCLYIKIQGDLEAFGSESSWYELALLGLCQILHEK